MCSAFPKGAASAPTKDNPAASSIAASRSKMSHRRVLEVRSSDGNSQRWRVSLSEDVFDSFIASGGGGEAARRAFGEGSLFSPLLFGKFFDPADAFPLWEFESEVLLSGLRNASESSVDWRETDAEYVLRAELPVGARKCEVEICGAKAKVVEISEQWRDQQEPEMRDWRIGRWWEHGHVRRLDLPENANWRKAEAYIDEDTHLEIKIPKNISDCSVQKNEMELKST